MNTLLRCIQIALLAAMLPSASLAAPGSGREGDEDRGAEERDDSSGHGSGRDDDDDDRYETAGDDRDYDDGDNSGPGSGGDRDDDRDYDNDNSGPGSGDDDHSGPSGGDDDDHSGSGGDDDHSGSSGGDDDHSGSGGGHSGSDDGHAGSGGGATEQAAELIHSAAHHLESPLEIVRDDEGLEYVRDEALMLCRPGDVARAVSRGFELIAQRPMQSDGRVVVRLLTPNGMSVDEAVAALHAIAPDAAVSRNTIFRSAQAASLVASTPSRRAGGQSQGLLGIIDTGADTRFLRRGSVVATRAFASSSYSPRQHGSVVASIAADSGVRVQLADVFSPDSDGEIAASADAIVAALDWMIDTGVPVINVSIEGPANPLLSEMVRTATQRGHIIVAAAGNGGPMAAPVFPAALDGAVAVTAVDDTNHAYRRANRGDYISFAARGVDIEVNLGGDVISVSGTSFAAPFVAARLAARHHRASPAHARETLDAMRANAVDLGRPGRDPIFGWGLISD
jgi:hypothetical protein